MSLLGEGGLGSLSGTNNSASPVTIADFRRGTGGKGPAGPGPDGLPCAAYGLRNNDTTGTLVANIQVSGLHTNGTVSGYALMPGEQIIFGEGDRADEVSLIRGWTSLTTGATTSSNTLISGGVLWRKG